MADRKALKNKKNIIIGACSALAIVAIIIVVIAIINVNKKLDDSYFVSDGSKYVLTINYSDISNEADASEEDTTNMPNKAHEVYTYSGDTITGLKYYYEYNDEDTAKKALDSIKEDDPEANISVEGKYVVIVAEESSYANYTASDIKETIEFYQKSMNENEDNEESEETKEAEQDKK